MFAFVAGVWLPSFAQSTSEDAALRFVTTHHIGGNLPSMALAVATRTQTFAMLSNKLGTAEARQLVEQEIAALVPQYQGQWDKNLASAYARHFSGEELASLTAEGPRSRYAAKLATMQKTLGDDMRTASQPMLTEMLGVALKNALSKVAK